MTKSRDEHQPDSLEESDTYHVGYKHPPRETQFQKGQSGNPQGRPKGGQNFKTDLAAELTERVRMTEGGEAKILTKQQALIKRTMEKGIKGDMRAIEALFKWRGLYLEDEPLDETPVSFSKHDQDILARAHAKWAESPSAHPEQEVQDAHTD